MLKSAVSVVVLLAILVVTVSATSDSLSVTSQSLDIRPGDNVTLQCRVNVTLLQEYPDLKFSWLRTNAHSNDTSTKILSWLEQSFYSDMYRAIYTPSEGTYNLTLLNASYENHDGRFECHLMNYVHQVMVTVLIPPSAPDISISSSVPLTENVSVTLNCSSFGGSPAPNISWYWQSQLLSSSHVLSPAHRSLPTVSSLTLNPTRQHDGSRLRCVVNSRALASNAQPLQKSTLLSVNYYPRIEMEPSNLIRSEEGNPVEMRCSVDAKPAVPNVRWIREGNYVGTSSVYRLDSVQKSDSGVYTCSAQNEVGETKEDLQLDVMYSPRVTVAPLESDVTVGGRVEITCSVDANPPADEVYWFKRGGLDFGRRYTDKLVLSEVRPGDAGVYECVAVNSLTFTNGKETVRRTGRAFTEVLVLHPPGVSSIVLLEKVAAVGNSMTLSCLTDPPGYPAPMYHWWKQEGDYSRLIYSASVNYSVASVQQSDQGVYACQASNDIGAGTRGSLSVSVLYPPQLDMVLQQQLQRKINSTRALRLMCSAEARPVPTVVWLKDGVVIDGGSSAFYQVQSVASEATQLPSPGAVMVRSSLIFSGDARPGTDQLVTQDRANYTCRFENVAGDAETTSSLRIEHAPFVRHEFDQAAFSINERAEIKCQMQGYPAPMFRWTHRGKFVGNSGDKLFSSTQSELGGDLHQSILVVRQVRQRDYGEYLCQARNSEGQSTAKLQLQPKSRPDPPNNVHLLNISSDWALLKWNPSFNGGYPDTIYQVSLLDENNNERTIDCRYQTQCNITQLLAQTTYRLRVTAENSGGISEPSEQIQFRLPPDPAELPLPTNVLVDWPSHNLQFDVPHFDGIVGVLDFKDAEGFWHTNAQTSLLHSSGVNSLELSAEILSDNVRVRLCLQRDVSVCGPSVDATPVEVGGLSVMSAVISPRMLVLAVPITVSLLLITLAVVICLCRRRQNRKRSNKNAPAPTVVAKLPPYYPPGASTHSVKTAVPCVSTPLADKSIYSSVNMDSAASIYKGYGVVDSNQAAGSTNSQDSLWQVKSTAVDGQCPDRSMMFTGEAALEHYDPAQANYQPDSVVTPVFHQLSASYSPYQHPPHYYQHYQTAPSGDGAGNLPSSCYVLDESVESGGGVGGFSSPNQSANRRVIREIVV